MAVNLDLTTLRREKFMIITRENDVELGWHLNADEKYAKKSADGQSWVVCLDNRPMYVYNDEKQESGWQRIENLTPTRLKDDEEGLLAWRTNLRIQIDTAHGTDAWHTETTMPTAAPYNTWHDTCRNAHLYGGVNYEYEVGVPSSLPGMTHGYHSE